MTSWQKEKMLREQWVRSIAHIAQETKVSRWRIQSGERSGTPMLLVDAARLAKFYKVPIDYFVDD